MSRISYTEEEDFPGQFNLWQANCHRSLRSKMGRKELQELRSALMTLPERRLILKSLTDEEGGVCAIGAYARHKGLDITKFDPEEETDQVGIKAGMPRLVAWKVVEMNDMELDHLTPELRYTAMLKWVEEQLI